MDEITIHETRDVLQRLVRERKALEKGLAAADQLSDIDINISNRQQLLDSLVSKCEAKQQELIEADENISAIHERREQACVRREQESQAKVELAKALLEDLRSKYAVLQSDHDRQSEELRIKYNEQVDEHQLVMANLKKQISALREELSDLQTTAKRLAGV